MSEPAGLIAAFQKDDALLEDIHRSNSYDGHFRLWWLGQSGFLLQYKQQHLLFDPYLSDSLSEKYAGTDKPHTRMSELVVDPAELGFVEIVTSSHNHTDHLDRDTLLPILTAKDLTHFLLPEANRLFASERLSLNAAFAIGMNDGETAHIDPFETIAVPAAHNTIERDEEGRCRFLGYVVRFGGWCVYHSGDTKHFEGMEELLRGYKIDVAMLPINGDKPERRVAGNLSAEEAAALGKAIGAGVVIPHHFHLFAFNTEDPAVFEAACVRMGTPFRVLRLGEKFSSAEWPGFAGRVPGVETPTE
ncbi:MAG: MBL fold metallo-hydrolase [Bryobacterales bacterium]|nr:MBL fold metallo-hydrolase [Bryobacterales bacterium]